MLPSAETGRLRFYWSFTVEITQPFQNPCLRRRIAGARRSDGHRTEPDTRGTDRRIHYADCLRGLFGKGHFFSYPAVGYHFIHVPKVIGNVHTFSIAESFGNRAEVGYTRSVHQLGEDPLLSSLWHYAGMNIFSGKVVALRDGQGGPLTPGLAVGAVVRTGDKFVTGALEGGTSYTNEDIYVAVSKTWLHPPFPFLANIGWKATNASIYGLGGQATRFGGRLFGGSREFRFPDPSRPPSCRLPDLRRSRRR